MGYFYFFVFPRLSKGEIDFDSNRVKSIFLPNFSNFFLRLADALIHYRV